MSDSLCEERKIQQLGHRERLRNRLISGCGRGLLDYEILELILCSARTRVDCKPIAKRLLEKFKTLSGVFYADAIELAKVKGVGNSSIAAIMCVRESLVRILRYDVEKSVVVDEWGKLVDYLRVKIGNSDVENFYVLYLNKRYGVIHDEVHNTGTVDEAPLYIREIIKKSLSCGAAHIVISHNHPSGDPRPSKADIEVTRKLKMACNNMSISLVDHIIVTPKRHYSFNTHGLL